MTDTITKSVADKFDTYRRMLRAVADGRMRFLLVTGQPGTGKSFDARDVLTQAAREIRGLKVTRYAGRTTPLAFYCALFDHRTTQDIVVFDDCDDAFRNRACVNILKAAADTSEPREISWLSTSKKVPVPKFQFVGRVIIITNHTLKTNTDLAPIIDRAHCFELALTQEERLSRILALLRGIAKQDECYYAVADWITRHGDALHALGRLTIRTGVKATELYRLGEADWERFADMTLLNASGAEKAAASDAVSWE